jgi:hypothetical protein
LTRRSDDTNAAAQESNDDEQAITDFLFGDGGGGGEEPSKPPKPPPPPAPPEPKPGPEPLPKKGPRPPEPGPWDEEPDPKQAEARPDDHNDPGDTGATAKGASSGDRQDGGAGPGAGRDGGPTAEGSAGNGGADMPEAPAANETPRSTASVDEFMKKLAAAQGLAWEKNKAVVWLEVGAVTALAAAAGCYWGYRAIHAKHDGASMSWQWREWDWLRRIRRRRSV